MKKLKHVIFISLTLILLSLSSICSADYGTVVYSDESRNIIVVQKAPYSLEQYTCAETISYTYPFPANGTIIYGSMASYGMKDWYDEANNLNFSVYVEEYWLTKNQVFDWIRGKR